MTKIKDNSRRYLNRESNGRTPDSAVRTWNDGKNTYRLVDAEEDLTVFITQEDIKTAKEKDPSLCIFANACRRAFNSPVAAFVRTKAIVLHPVVSPLQHHPDIPVGEMCAFRYSLPKEVSKCIRLFDMGKRNFPDGGFKLKAPVESQRLDRQLRYARNRREQQRKAIMRGELIETTKRGKQGPLTESVLSRATVRHGAGMFQMQRKLAA